MSETKLFKTFYISLIPTPKSGEEPPASGSTDFGTSLKTSDWQKQRGSQLQDIKLAKTYIFRTRGIYLQRSL